MTVVCHPVGGRVPELTPWVIGMSPLRGFVCVSALSVCSVVSVGSVFSVGSATVDSATPLRFARNDRRLSSCGRSRPRAYALGYRNVAPSGLCLWICSHRVLCRLCGLCCLCGLCYLCVLCTKSKGHASAHFLRGLFSSSYDNYIFLPSPPGRGAGGEGGGYRTTTPLTACEPATIMRMKYIPGCRRNAEGVMRNTAYASGITPSRSSASSRPRAS
jgi:hypothetical protein